MYEKVVENLKEIGTNRRLNKLLIQSMEEVKLTRKSAIQYVVSFVLATIISYIFTYKGDTVELFYNAVEVINNASLALVAIIFGTYSIFQALMTDTVMWALLSSENNLLNTSNRSFLNLIVLYLTEIITNMVLLIVLKAVPNNSCISESLQVTNMLAFVTISIYLGVCFLLFYEMRNFAVNLYQMFNVYNIYKGIELLEKKLKEDGEEEKD